MKYEATVIIKEFLPNPAGKDTDGEWIKLFNNGSKEINLADWYIKDVSGKVFYFNDLSIKSGEYLILDYKTTKIYLNNKGETLFLFDKNNTLVDQLGFSDIVSEDEIITKDRDLINIEDSTQNSALVSQIVNLPSNQSFDLNILFIGLAICLILSFLAVAVIKKNKEDNA